VSPHLPWRLLAATAVAVLAAGCGTVTIAGTPGAEGAFSKPGSGPVTVVAVGDSLTAGDGDPDGGGFVGRLVTRLSALPGRAGSTAVNLGRSGWTSEMLVDGGEGEPGQLGPAVEAIRAARAEGRAVVSTLLIGSNDLWFVYANGSVDPTPGADEDAAVAAYGANVDRAIATLRGAGAAVVVGLPDDQSLRTGVADLGRLQQQLPGVTAEEVVQMSRLADRLVRTATEIAARYDAPTVETDDPLWADEARMDADGIHPNGAGYEVLAGRFADVIGPLLA
jgi:lysophospholipase L1-like esterase